MFSDTFGGTPCSDTPYSYSYDIQSFVGEVGGTLGLFLGLSVFSFVEFAEYLLRKMYSERPEGT